MARRMIFDRITPGGYGKTAAMSVDMDKMVENAIGVAWRIDHNTIRIIPYAQISEITIKED